MVSKQDKAGLDEKVLNTIFTIEKNNSQSCLVVVSAKLSTSVVLKMIDRSTMRWILHCCLKRFIRLCWLGRFVCRRWWACKRQFGHRIRH